MENVLCVASLSTPAPVAMQPDTREKGREGKKQTKHFGDLVMPKQLYSLSSSVEKAMRLDQFESK